MSPEELHHNVSPTLAANGILRITVTDGDPDLAVSIADGIADRFIQYIAEIREPQYIEAEARLSAQLTELGQSPTDAGAQKVANTLTTIARRPSVIVAAEILNDPLVKTQPAAPAAPPGIFTSNTIRNTVLGLVFGGLVSIAAILLLEYWQGPVRSPRQLEQQFGLTHLGSIPRWNKRKVGRQHLAVTDNHDRASVEAIQQAATSIDFVAVSQGKRVLAVTSPETGDGRTSVVANLAIALASGWENVILVDADLRQPALHTYFNLDNCIGLSTLIINPNMDLNDVLQETPYQRLKVIASGPTPANPMEILRCPRMAWVVQQLQDTGSMVVLDTPPLLATSDAAIISSLADGVLMVIDSGRGKLEEVEAALSTIRRAEAAVLGFVWNQVARRPFSSYSKRHRYYRRLEEHPATISSSTLGAGHEPKPTGSLQAAGNATAEVLPR